MSKSMVEMREKDARHRCSRAEIETLCLLAAVGARGAEIRDVPARLGVSEAHAAAILRASRPLIACGWFEQSATELRLTEKGEIHLQRRLDELGVLAR